MLVPVLIATLSTVAGGLSDLSASELDAYVADLASREPAFGDRLVSVVRFALGTPYAGGPLGEGPNGRYDTDPLVDYSRVDCVTFVEQSIALAASSSTAEAFEKLQRIRYREGQIAFENRNHFMVADWLRHNGFCSDVTESLGVPVAHVKRTVGRVHFFRVSGAEELARRSEDEVIDLTYVASADASRAEPHLPSPALVCFVGKIDWLFVVHCGIYVRENGNGTLYHASSDEGQVAATDFVEYVTGSARHLGFVAYAIREPEWPATLSEESPSRDREEKAE